MNLPTRIGSFKGGWSFLSNFYPANVKLWIDERNVPYAHDITPFIARNIEIYPSVEHAYQAAKFLDPKIRARFQWATLSAGQAKAMGYDLRDQVRADWKEVSLEIMRDLNRQKYTPSILKRKLLATFQAELIEGNWWSDEFWGVCYGCAKDGPHEPRGLNHLGKILMEIRRGLVPGLKSNKR